MGIPNVATSALVRRRSADDGRVVQDGSVDQLLAAGGSFDEFWRQQQDAADWQIYAG
jgi:ABC-type multidrug transport system fused ATPase/permease subunit